MALNVYIKHAGNKYDLELDPEKPPLAFKEAVYQSTGVPIDRMKIMVKGGVLKDDSDWKKIGPKEGQTFMVIGAAGELPKPPAEPTRFLEDMNDTELADVLGMPVGLTNLGNTCYMSATIQALRAIPELQAALSEFAHPIFPVCIPPNTHYTSRSRDLNPIARSLRDLYASMASSTGGVMPLAFLTVLRDAVPQFAERSRTGNGYAQQDAEECWTQLTNRLKDVPGESTLGASSSRTKFIDQYMTGTLVRTLSSPEAPDEPPSVSEENVLKVECNITVNTNFMLSGIMEALNQPVVKHSATLGREATYNSRSRLSRLPFYLAVHMVRFTWRRDINKKAKIMRKVKFPNEFDALDIVTDELREKMRPIASKRTEIEKAREERRKVRKRTRAAVPAAQGQSVDAASATEVNVESSNGGDVEMNGPGPEQSPGDELRPEEWYGEQEKRELEALIDPSIKADIGASQTGLYDLVAIITHKGAAADSGHYIAFVARRALTGKEEDQDWVKFDDDKVSVFPADKLATLDGGGEDSAAYVLLYRSKGL
ncbi:cysteine proteinase [Multifurca ochricompacta]|uniref:Ubiquitin carboxyl-terminal hydrolase n=1 Tax=Multifurca ochricompacta TaxID=376703 RepID=A0AAD4M4C4_9AGAM|nr:cysteine proteinase [Multifurca ochricompacta]